MIKTILLSSLIVMAIVVITQQRVNAELSFKESLIVDNAARLGKSHLQICIGVLKGDPFYPESDMKSQLQMTKAEVLATCDKDILTTVNWCKFVGEQGDRYRKSGLCEDPSLSAYIDGRNLWNKID